MDPSTESESEFYEGFVDRRDDAAATGGGGGGMFPVLPESTPGELGDQFEGDSTRPVASGRATSRLTPRPRRAFHLA